MSRTWAIAIAVSLVIASAASADDDLERRAKTIEALQTAGANSASAAICSMAGYVTDDDERSAYVAREVEFAKAAGMFEEMAYSYASNGQQGQSAADLGRLRKLTQLVEAGDPAGKTGMVSMINDVVDRCDFLASRSETRAMFSYVPLNPEVAKRLALRNMGLAK